MSSGLGFGVYTRGSSTFRVRRSDQKFSAGPEKL